MGKLYGFRAYALVLVLLAFLFVVLAFASPNPIAVGGEALLAKQQPAKGIQRITRHPFLCGVALWALTHLILNGDLASAVFVGSLPIVAFAGPFSIDRKRRKVAGEWRSQGSLYLPRRVRQRGLLLTRFRLLHERRFCREALHDYAIIESLAAH